MTNAIALQWADIITEQIRAECKQRARQIPEEVNLRYTFVPFCLAQGCWDMADTIIDMAIQMRLTPTKPLSRAIRTLRRDYDKNRHRTANPEEEMDNFLFLENDEAQVLSDINSYIKESVKEQYPDLDQQNTLLLCAVYACHIMLLVLYQYANAIARQLQQMIGIEDIPAMIPSQLFKLDPIILQFAGDKPLTLPDKQKFIDTLVDDLLNVTFPDNE